MIENILAVLLAYLSNAETKLYTLHFCAKTAKTINHTTLHFSLKLKSVQQNVISTCMLIGNVGHCCLDCCNLCANIFHLTFIKIILCCKLLLILRITLPPFSIAVVLPARAENTFQLLL